MKIINKKTVFSFLIIFIFVISCIHIGIATDKTIPDTKVNLTNDDFWDIYIDKKWDTDCYYLHGNVSVHGYGVPDTFWDGLKYELSKMNGINFTLYQNDIEIESKNIDVLSGQSRFLYGTYPKYDENGNEYIYRMEENVQYNAGPYNLSCKSIKSIDNGNDKTFEILNGAVLWYLCSNQLDSHTKNLIYPNRDIEVELEWIGGKPIDKKDIEITLIAEDFSQDKNLILKDKDNYYNKINVTYYAGSKFEITTIVPEINGYTSSVKTNYSSYDTFYSPSIYRTASIKITMTKKQMGAYQVKHEYYVKDKNNNLTLENTISENVVSDIIVGTIIDTDKLNQIPENNGKNYTFLEHTGNITIEENNIKEITIKYVREEKYGSYVVKHEYYTKDKDDNLTLENTVSENVVSNIVVDTVIEAEKINPIPKNNGKNYIFLEHTGNITIEENFTKEITIKYIRDKEYGSYVVKHEYYTKDKDGNMILDKMNIEEVVLLETGTVLDTSTIELKPEQYTYSEISDKTVTIETDVEKIITIKYVKEEKYGFYQVKHEYYVKDKENNLTLENTVSENIVSNVIVGTIIEADKINQIPENNDKNYTFYEHTGNITIEENITKEITIKYVRNKEYGSYVVKHNYYVKDKNGNFILEETVLEDSVLAEPNVSIGLKDADIIISQKLIDGYKFKDSSENMTIQTNKEIEFVINYFREEFIIIEYGSYQVIHQYYLDDKLETTITENTVSNIKVGTNVGVADADILVSKKLNHNNKNYEFISANKVIIESNKTATLIIKYVRKTETIIPEEVKPVSVSITAKKKLENSSLKDKQFSFRLTNGLVTYIAENDSHGNVIFNPLTFDTEGTYKFTLTEDNTNESNIQYDSSIYDLEIVVSKVDNSLTASVKYFKDGKEFSEINFINKYELPKEEKPSDNKSDNNTTEQIKSPDNVLKTETNNVNTGDKSPIIIYFILFIFSGVSFFFIKKRKN